DEAKYKDTYGALYNWYTVQTKNICPLGWHVPTDNEWITLADYLGGGSVAGGKLKESGTTHWRSPNTGATNESGFTALPGGHRYDYSGTFHYIKNYTTFWSSIEENDAKAWYRQMIYSAAGIARTTHPKKYGCSVRCVGH
ncbi:MAG: fibrobacter succinogenes major paralogous domain-containing protein, partial [Bacteroidales bacterium]